MKKYILLAIAVMSVGGYTFAQDAKEEMTSFMEDGLVKWSSEDKGVSFRVGARVGVDGAYYIDDVTDRGSGFGLTEARLRVYSSFAENFDAKFDIDFARNKVAIKDMYVRYHLGQSGMFYVGNFSEPFSASSIQSSADNSLMFKSSTVSALGTGRALGVSYRYYADKFWGEAGMFSEKISSNESLGDKGWSFSTRMLFRYTPCGEDYGFHVGGSFNFRHANASGYETGKDDHNRVFNVNSSLESSIDKTHFLDATVFNADKVMRYGAEAIGFWRNLYVQGEYIGSNVSRNKDWETLFKRQLGGLWDYDTMEAFKSWFGDDRDINFNGYYAELGWLIKGGNYSYNSTSALMNRPGKGAFEMLVRYNHTDLDDVDGVWFDGRFYEDQASGKPNNSVSGGKVNSCTVGLNYYVTNNLIVKLNYNYQRLTSYSYLDKNLNSVMCRLFFEF